MIKKQIASLCGFAIHTKADHSGSVFVMLKNLKNFYIKKLHVKITGNFGHE